MCCLTTDHTHCHGLHEQRFEGLSSVFTRVQSSNCRPSTVEQRGEWMSTGCQLDVHMETAETIIHTEKRRDENDSGCVFVIAALALTLPFTVSNRVGLLVGWRAGGRGAADNHCLPRPIEPPGQNNNTPYIHTAYSRPLNWHTRRERANGVRSLNIRSYRSGNARGKGSSYNQVRQRNGSENAMRKQWNEHVHPKP